MTQAKSQKREPAKANEASAGAPATKARKARPSKASAGVPESRLYVNKLPYSVNNTALRETFDKFGKILECYVVYKDRR